MQDDVSREAPKYVERLAIGSARVHDDRFAEL
jgi:hypothetical protein